MNYKNILGKTLRLAAAAFLALTVSSCVNDGPKNPEFELFYPGITDVGPSIPMTLTPTYYGGTPSGFKIAGGKHDGKEVQADCFSINEKNGTFTMAGTENLATGIYTVSISCVNSGKTHTFRDVITINMMKVIPDGITAEPSQITVALTDITEPGSDTVLPTSRITTDGNHISIQSYAVAGARRNGTTVTNAGELFRVSPDGIFTIVANNPDFLPGVYDIDFKLTTFVVDKNSEEGIFANAIRLNVTSAPKSLEYKPAEVKLEEVAESVYGVPEVAGSIEGLAFSFESIVKMGTDGTSRELDETEAAFIEINGETGAITVKAGHPFLSGEVLTLAVTVANSYGSMTAARAMVITVVERITPIANFSYAAVNVVQLQKIEQKVADTFEGDDVVFTFVDLPADLEGILVLDPNSGAISAPRYNEIPVGTYTVKVHAENKKGGEDASFVLTVAENPNYFTYLHYGNNLGLGKNEGEVVSYPAQYRIDFDAAKTIDIPLYASDLKPGTTVTYTLKAVYNFFYQNVDKHSVDNTDGTLHLNFEGAARNIQMFKVIATAGEGETSVTRETMVFIHLSKTVGAYKVEFTPFIMRYNPKTGISKDTPVLKVSGAAPEAGNFAMDFRGTFYYVNLDGPDTHTSGTPAEPSGDFLNRMWNKYYTSINKPINTGARDPVSAFGRPATLNSNLLYVDNADDWKIRVNPNIWYDDDGWANGLFIGQMIFGNSGGGDPNGTYGGGSLRIFQCALWFDEKY